MYKTIIHPITKQHLNVFSAKAKKILKKYIYLLGGVKSEPKNLFTFINNAFNAKKTEKNNCRGQTMFALNFLLTKYEPNSLYWGDFFGHSVAIVSNKKLDIEKKINLNKPDDLENIQVWDGSFWQVNPDRHFFIGLLSEYAKHWNKKCEYEDKKSAIFFQLEVHNYDIWKDWLPSQK